MRLPPGPRGVVQVWPQAKGFAADPVGAMAAIHRRYGPVACMRILGDLLVFVAEPELVGEVLLDREGIFIKDKVTHSLGRFLGQGLLTSENPLWRRQRRLIAPSLTRRHIELYAGAMARAADRYARARVDGELRDLHADMTAVTLEIVVETLFGASFTGSVELVGQMMDAVMHNFERVSRSWKRKLPEWAPVRERRSMDAAAGVLDAMVLEIIRERRASGVLGDDLLSRLIAARDDAGSGMSDEQLRDEAVTLFVAGHETTANALTFALMLLAEHPEEDARRRAECAAVLGDRLPGVADLPRLRQSEAVIKESLRLYPPAYLFGRESTRAFHLGPWLLPPGTTFLMAPGVLHADPRFFDDPAAFRPARWLDGSADAAPRHAYVPFGGGARICVGNHFAMMEAILCLAVFGQHLRLERVDRRPLPLQAAVTLRPAAPLRMRVRRGPPAA